MCRTDFNGRFSKVLLRWLLGIDLRMTLLGVEFVAVIMVVFAFVLPF